MLKHKTTTILANNLQNLRRGEVVLVILPDSQRGLSVLHEHSI